MRTREPLLEGDQGPRRRNGALMTDDPCIVAGATGVARIDRNKFMKMMQNASYKLHDFELKKPDLRLLNERHGTPRVRGARGHDRGRPAARHRRRGVVGLGEARTAAGSARCTRRLSRATRSGGTRRRSRLRTCASPRASARRPALETQASGIASSPSSSSPANVQPSAHGLAGGRSSEGIASGSPARAERAVAASVR